MSTHLPAIERRLRQAGYLPHLAKAGGSHHEWIHPETGHTICLAHHGKSSLYPPFVLRQIEQQIAAGVAVQQALQRQSGASVQVSHKQHPIPKEWSVRR